MPRAPPDSREAEWNKRARPGPTTQRRRAFPQPAGTEIRVPYWYAVKGDEVAAIPLIGQTATGRRNGQLREAIYFRVTDAAGVPIEGALPEVEPLEGGGRVLGISSLDAQSPGLFAASVRLGPAAGMNTFRVEAGEKTLMVSITGE
jgi:hypothetical protein